MAEKVDARSNGLVEGLSENEVLKGNTLRVRMRTLTGRVK